MSGPMQMYLLVHEAILRETADFEAVAKELNRESAEDIARFSERMSWFHDTIKVHEKAEEEILFPALDKRYRFMAEAYFFDHDDQDEHVFVGINSALAGLSRGGSNGDLRDHADFLYRQSVALNEHMRLHITKENELLVSKIESEFDISEQVEIAGAMAAFFDPPPMAQVVDWMYRGQKDPDREVMIRFLMNALPAEPFAGLSGMLAGIDETTWKEMLKRASPSSRPDSIHATHRTRHT